MPFAICTEARVRGVPAHRCPARATRDTPSQEKGVSMGSQHCLPQPSPWPLLCFQQTSAWVATEQNERNKKETSRNQIDGPKDSSYERLRASAPLPPGPTALHPWHLRGVGAAAWQQESQERPAAGDRPSGHPALHQPQVRCP